VIEKESSLLVASEQTFRVMFAVDVRTHCEAISISPKKKTVDLRNVQTGEVTTESYDKLVLSPEAPVQIGKTAAALNYWLNNERFDLLLAITPFPKGQVTIATSWSDPKSVCALHTRFEEGNWRGPLRLKFS
jgi:hypothetical protein